jgi:hypothetical protein
MKANENKKGGFLFLAIATGVIILFLMRKKVEAAPPPSDNEIHYSGAIYW